MTGWLLRISENFLAAALKRSSSLTGLDRGGKVFSLNNDGLEPLCAHDGAEAAASGVAGGVAVVVVVGDAGSGEHHLSGGADGDDCCFGAVALKEHLCRLVDSLAGKVVCWEELGTF